MNSFLKIALLCGVLYPGQISFCQSSGDSTRQSNENAVKVFLDCDRCDHEFLKSEITFVNYVRDRNEAQVHILVSTQRTGSNGLEYTITFLGQKEYNGLNDTLIYASKKAEAEDITRQGIAKILKLGLIRYAEKTPLSDQISVSYTSPAKSTETVDKWDYWVFSLNTNTFLDGSGTSTSTSFHNSISANRVTKDLKINMSVGTSYNENSYDYSDDNGSYSYKSISRNHNFNSLVVVSLNDHWSAGGSLSGFTSTYSNTKFSFTGAPAIEFDLFPYSESTRRQLRFLYKLQFTTINYEDTTIYDKTSEQLAGQNLSVSLDFKEPWGSAGFSLEGSHYFHDANKYLIGVFGSMSLQLVEGLSLNLFGDYSKVHNQLGIAKGGASQEDVLLQRRELETQYRYFVSVGISYTFGSIFNNIVNPRFGSNGGGGFSFSFSN